MAYLLTEIVMQVRVSCMSIETIRKNRQTEKHKKKTKGKTLGRHGQSESKIIKKALKKRKKNLEQNRKHFKKGKKQTKKKRQKEGCSSVAVEISARKKRRRLEVSEGGTYGDI